MTVTDTVPAARVTCPACGGTSHQLAFRVGPAEIRRCRGCGIGRTVPPPEESDGRERFAHDPAYFEDAVSQPKDRWWHRFSQAPLDLLAAAGAGPGLTLLDVGCNVGYLVAMARARGYAARGIDASPAAVAVGRARLGVDLVCSRLEAAAVPPESEDVVVLNHVVEHLAQPLHALGIVRGWIRPGGFVLVALPNFASPIARVAGPRWAGLVPGQHVWHFTPAALSRLVTSAGFTPVRRRTRMLVHAPASVGDWGKWIVRRGLEPLGLADNLLLLARRA